MIATSNRNRQIFYSVGILALFGLMLPYTRWLRDRKESRQLGEATIGQVDAGSFMLKLALLGGARGVAANVLWGRALDLQKVHDWDRLKLTVDQITKLQPHFLRVWSWQGWNLAYNVSVEWDAPEDKYEWIKQGIKFLKEGVSKNEKSPDLMWDTAWTYYQKVGISDESIILRRLFYDDEDEEFRAYVDPDTNQRITPQDNFLLGYGWFLKAVHLVDRGAERVAAHTEAPVEYVDRVEQRKGHPGDLHFRSMPAGSLTKYASSLEKASTLGIRPTFGERARAEWTRARRAWQAFGDHPFPAHNAPELMIYMDDAVYPSLKPGRLGWRQLQGDPKVFENQKYWTNRWADNTHYQYWKDRTIAEADSRGVAARKLFYEGMQAVKGADFLAAVAKYREGLELWASLLKDHPIYRNDDLNKQDTGRVLLGYDRALRGAGMDLPADMPFKDVLTAAQADSNPDPFDENDMQVATPGQDTMPSRQ